MDLPVGRIPIRELVRYYLRLGLLGFGGPVALVGQMGARDGRRAPSRS